MKGRRALDITAVDCQSLYRHGLGWLNQEGIRVDGDLTYHSAGGDSALIIEKRRPQKEHVFPMLHRWLQGQTRVDHPPS
jgi:hypothetical protein